MKKSLTVAGLLILSFLAPPRAVAQGATVLMLGGTQAAMLSLVPPSLFGFTPATMPANSHLAMASELRGELCRTNRCIPVNYPATMGVLSTIGDGIEGLWSAPGLFESMETGVSMLSDAIAATPGPIVVASLSQGSVVADLYMARHDPDPRLTFVLLGDPDNLFSGINRYLLQLVGPAPTQGHRIYEVIQRQDGFANVTTALTLKTLTATLLGLMFSHVNYTQVSLRDPGNIVTQDGTITYVLTPVYGMPTVPGYGADNPPGEPLSTVQLQAALADVL